MASNRCLIKSDLLCFALCKFNRVPLRSLKSLMLECYSGEAISDAKALFLQSVHSLNIDNLPRITANRRDSIDKAALDLDDIFALISLLDERLKLDSLPIFVGDNPE